jgi:hypothetical protein
LTNWVVPRRRLFVPDVDEEFLFSLALALSQGERGEI